MEAGCFSAMSLGACSSMAKISWMKNGVVILSTLLCKEGVKNKLTAADWGKLAGGWKATDDVDGVAEAAVVDSGEGRAALAAWRPFCDSRHHKGCTHAEAGETG